MNRPPRPAATILAGALTLAALAACTSGSATPVRSSTVTRVQTRTTTPPPHPVPVDTGPTSSATAGRCPLLATQQAADDVGMRLARITVQRSANQVVGCRFYALQGSPLATSERLPGPNQPVIAIETARYPSDVDAHNAMVLRSRAGTDARAVTLAGGVTGVIYRTEFDPADHGQDWACAFAKGNELTVVTTAVTKTSVNAITLAGRFSA